MTDKEKIRAEIERLKESGCESPIVICDTLLTFIDSVQEEPEKIKKGCKYRCLGDMLNNDTGSISFFGGKIYLAPEDDALVSEENGWRCDVSEDASNFELVEEPVHRTKADVDAAMQEVEEKSKAFTDANKGESAEEILAQMKGEEPILEVLAKYLDHVSHEEAMKTKGAIDRWFAEYYQEPVSDDLEDAADKYSQSIHSDYSNDMFDTHNIYDAVIYGAQWQKQKDKAQILILKDQIESCHAAMKCKDELMEIKLHEQKEEMMKDAIHGRWIRNSIVLPCEFDNRFDDGKYVTIIIKED